MKLYMLCDMEGVSGLCVAEQCWRASDHENLYQEGRQLMTRDVNSAVAAALGAGVDELVVNDTHSGGGRNVVWEDLLADPRVTYESPGVSGTLMPSLDETFAGLILLGHHAKAGTQEAFLDHTWSEEWFDVAINGMSVGEVGIETCYAGHWDVPLVMVQGDEAACREAARQFPGIETASVKRATGRKRAGGPAPEIARQFTRQAIARAVTLAREGAPAPYKPELPLTVRFTGTSTSVCEKIALRPGVRRIDGRTLEAKVERQCDLLRWLVG